ncbi:MAG: competence protein CoiA family protein [Smithellaceae bacterium]
MKVEHLTSKTLQVPYALNSSGELITPVDAIKGGNFFCPLCNEKLTLRKGKIKIPHFAHSNNSNCTNETILHKIAKMLVINSVNNFVNGKGKQPEIVRTCIICSGKHIQKLPSKITHASEEVRLDTGFIADVGLFGISHIEAVVEVFVAHLMESKKKENLGIPFIEIKAEDLVNNPTLWTPINDNLKSVICRECHQRFSNYSELIKKLSDKFKLNINMAEYGCGVTICWKCHNQIPVFLIEEVKANFYPKTVKFMYSHTRKERYFANTCPICQSLQGDFYLNDEPDGPFFCLSCINEKSVDNLSRIQILNYLIVNWFYENRHPN